MSDVVHGTLEEVEAAEREDERIVRERFPPGSGLTVREAPAWLRERNREAIEAEARESAERACAP